MASGTTQRSSISQRGEKDLYSENVFQYALVAEWHTHYVEVVGSAGSSPAQGTSCQNRIGKYFYAIR